MHHMPYSSIGHVMHTDLVATGQYSGDNVFMHHMPHTKKYQVTERGYYREYQMACWMLKQSLTIFSMVHIKSTHGELK